MLDPSLRCTAFSGALRVASGQLRHVAIKAKQAHDAHPERSVRVFDDAGGRLVELPLALPEADLLRLIEQPEAAQARGRSPRPRRRPGRPRLGVVAREVTLLPEQWEWLAVQPGGASLALRRLVDAARAPAGADGDRRRASQEACYRFLRAMIEDGDRFESLARALFAGDDGRFEHLMLGLPEDEREHAACLALDALGV